MWSVIFNINQELPLNFHHYTRKYGSILQETSSLEAGHVKRKKKKGSSITEISKGHKAYFSLYFFGGGGWIFILSFSYHSTLIFSPFFLYPSQPAVFTIAYFPLFITAFILNSCSDSLLYQKLDMLHINLLVLIYLGNGLGLTKPDIIDRLITESIFFNSYTLIFIKV